MFCVNISSEEEEKKQSVYAWDCFISSFILFASALMGLDKVLATGFAKHTWCCRQLLWTSIALPVIVGALKMCQLHLLCLEIRSKVYKCYSMGFFFKKISFSIQGNCFSPQQTAFHFVIQSHHVWSTYPSR